jgi:hypothetical protein
VLCGIRSELFGLVEELLSQALSMHEEIRDLSLKPDEALEMAYLGTSI